ncbi:MAG: phage terminase large subunit family protein, partial [Hyphomonas sp.]|nr:phage terminase large subunit family protein [Hyphomonas sp.]
LPPEIDEGLARQLTAEHLKEQIVGGKRVLLWEKPQHQANEQLDMAVYSMALGVHAGLDRLRWEDWERLADARRRPETDAAPAPLEALWAGNGSVEEAAPADSAPAARKLNPVSAGKAVPEWMRKIRSQHKDQSA